MSFDSVCDKAEQIARDLTQQVKVLREGLIDKGPDGAIGVVTMLVGLLEIAKCGLLKEIEETPGDE